MMASLPASFIRRRLRQTSISGIMPSRSMRMSPREADQLSLSAAGQLAQRRLARGTRLNHPEAVALIASMMQERIRDGESVTSLMTVGKRLLGRRQVSIHESHPD